MILRLLTLCISFALLAPVAPALAQDGGAPDGGDATTQPAGDSTAEAAAAKAEEDAKRLKRYRQNFFRYLAKLDSDGDGKISKEEAGRSRNLMRSDTNGDGVVEESEYVEWRRNRDQEKAERRARRSSGRSSGERNVITDARDQLEHLDKNGDGKLDAKEGGAMFRQRESADIDGDGVVVLEELVIYQRNRRDQVTSNFEKKDRNKDGKLSKSEDPELFERLASADADGDGLLSMRELREVERQRRRDRRERYKMSVADRFRALDVDRSGQLSQEEAAELLELRPDIDADRNGRITVDEFKKGITVDPVARASDEQRLRKFMETHDQNKDGVLSGDEVGDLTRNFPGIDQDEDGRITPQEAAAALGRSREPMDPFSFATHDKNKDGKIDRQESPWLFRKGSIDANDDGEITREEFNRLPGAKD